MGTQIRFALVPALFTSTFDHALVIGLGTGHTLRTVSRFPFRKIHVVELAPQLVEAAREWFADVNDRVFDRDPRVSLSIADGRNFLVLSQERYDMITLESSSLWISGQADFYNKEFYELCRSHLSEKGVLQQWVALHHLRTQDFLVILNTAAQVFPHLAFFQGSDSHGFLIGSMSPLEVDYATITRLDEDPAIRADLTQLGIPSAWSMLGEVQLYEKSFHLALASFTSFTQLRGNFASTDFYPYLEYQAPKGLAVRYDTVHANVDFLKKYRTPGQPTDLNVRGVPSEDEAQRIRRHVLERQNALRDASK
jgi:spermidine synthase